MIVWFVEIPFILIVLAALAMYIIGSMLIGWTARAMFAVGLVMMAATIPILIVSAALQHVSVKKTKTCDKIMKFLCINGATLFVLGFLIICLLETTIAF